MDHQDSGENTSRENSTCSSAQTNLSVINTLTSTVNFLKEDVSRKNSEIDSLKSMMNEKDLLIAQLKEKVTAFSCAQQDYDQRKSDKVVSATFKAIYKTLDDGEQFKPDEGICSSHNCKSRAAMTKLLKEAHPEMNVKVVENSIKNKYNTERKLYREQQLSGEARERTQKRRRIVARRQNTYQTRLATATRLNKHVDIIKMLSQADMSDLESDGETFVAKAPRWRSTNHSEICHELDSLMKTKSRRKVRGSPSKRSKRIAGRSEPST